MSNLIHALLDMENLHNDDLKRLLKMQMSLLTCYFPPGSICSLHYDFSMSVFFLLLFCQFYCMNVSLPWLFFMFVFKQIKNRFNEMQSQELLTSVTLR